MVSKSKTIYTTIKKLRMEVKACDNIRNRSFKDDVERIAWKKNKTKRTITLGGKSDERNEVPTSRRL